MQVDITINKKDIEHLKIKEGDNIEFLNIKGELIILKSYLR